MKDNNLIQDIKNFIEYRGNLYIMFVIILLSVFIIRLFQLQIIEKDYYNKLANEQYINKDINIYNRGNIYFSNKDEDHPVLAAIDKDVSATNSKGLTITKKERFYSFGEIGAKVLGFVGYVDDEKVGQYGIEQYYNDVLNKKNIDGRKNVFFQLFDSSDLFKNKDKTQDGYGDVYITIDANVQNYLYLVLKDTYNKWHSDNVGAIVIDPSTGKIIAMDEYPTFDPNDIKNVKDISVFKNDLISGVYELGSIIKPLTMSAAIDSDSVNKDDTYNDTGTVLIDGYKVSNFDKKARGIIPLAQILAQSLNVGIVHIVNVMGIDTFQKYFKSFGLGVETGISLFGEVNSLVSNLDSPISVDNATAGFGQGIALTPIQTVRALSAVANGGILLDPYITDRIEYEDGRVYKYVPNQGVRVMKEETSKAVTDMLVHIVDDNPYYKNRKDKLHSIAVKTGTAQIPKKGGGYLDDSFLHSFVGYFPANNPKYLVFIFQKNPKTASFSSDTLAPAFFKMKNFLVDYYDVPPDR